MANGKVLQFAPADKLARWAQGLLTAEMALAVAGVVIAVANIPGVLQSAPEGELSLKELLEAISGLLQLIFSIGAFIAFLVWFYRVHKNLRALRANNLEFSPGWAVGGFFVPFLNLVRPLQVMREVWYCSDPSMFKETDDLPVRNRNATPPLIGWWWALFLVSSFANNIATRMAMSDTSSPDLLELSTVVSLVANVLAFPSALLAVRIVGKITSWQLERNALIQQGAMSSAASAAPIA